MLAVAQAYGAQIFQVSEDQAQQELRGLAHDSRAVEPGFLFVAIPGGQTDGHNYIDQALNQGALAIVAEKHPPNFPANKPLILAENSRHLLARLAATYFGHPELELHLIGVTGTNGKTTTTHLIKYLLNSCGRKAGLVGTINNKAGSKILPANFTTPEPLELFELLAIMRSEGCTDVVMEVSSHALALGRTIACNFSGAIFTNLSQDHLDFHGTYDAYQEAKLLLFSGLEKSSQTAKYGIINLDDAAADAFIKACAAPYITYGEHPDATLRLLKYSSNLQGSKFSFSYAGADYQVEIPLIGKFNVYNALAALGCIVCEGLNLAEACNAFKRAPQVPGRFELINLGQDFGCAIDYAHTPDGLENLLQAARLLNPRRLITVFGCGGDRDASKRPVMGKVAASLSDITIVTTDNPRTEDPLFIIKQVEVGLKAAAKPYLVEVDRAAAIKLAIETATAGDLVVIAGKGHEDYQIIGTEKIHFDDREQAKAAINTIISSGGVL